MVKLQFDEIIPITSKFNDIKVMVIPLLMGSVDLESS